MTVAITGSSGFIGSNLLKHLVHQLEVVGFDFKEPGLDPWSLITKIDEGAGFTEVLHFGANSNAQAKNLGDLIVNNFEYTKTLAAACAKRRIPLLFASSAAVYGNLNKDSLSAYAESKRMSEEILIQIGKEFPDWKKISLRLSNVFGEGEEKKGSMQSIPYRFLMNSLNNQPIEIWSVKHGKDRIFSSRDFLYIDDLCRIVSEIRNKHSLWSEPIIDVGSGTTRSFLEIANIVVGLSRTEVLLTDFPESVDRRHYQMTTRANLDALLKIFPTFKPTELDDAIEKIFINEVAKSENFLDLKINSSTE